MFRTSAWWARELARREQAWTLERGELLDRIMFLAGRTWTPPPYDPDDVPTFDDESVLGSAFDGLPPGYDEEIPEPTVYVGER